MRRKRPKYHSSTKPKAQTPVNISQRRSGRRSLGNSLCRAWTAIWIVLWLSDGAWCGIVTQAGGGFKMGKGGSKQIRHNVSSSPDPMLALGSFVAESPETRPGTSPRSVMRKTALKTALALSTLAATFTVALAAERPMRFWNLTRHTISEFYLAPAGTTNWGANQCKNDRDGTVDSDERLRITDTPPGRYRSEEHTS